MKNKHLLIRLSGDEKTAIQDAAYWSNETVSGFMRRIIMAKAKEIIKLSPGPAKRRAEREAKGET